MFKCITWVHFQCRQHCGATQKVKTSLQVTPASRFQHFWKLLPTLNDPGYTEKQTQILWASSRRAHEVLLLIFSQQNDMTWSAQSLCPDHNLVLADNHCTAQCAGAPGVVTVFLKTDLCIHCCVHWHVSSMAAIIIHWTITLKATVPSSPLKPLHSASFDLSGPLEFGKVVKQLEYRGSKSAHVWVWTTKIFRLAQEERKCVLKARNISPCSQNIWWADRDTFTPSGTHVTQQLPVAAALHSVKKTLLFQREPQDEWKESKWRRRIWKIVARLCKVKNWPYSSEVPPWFCIVIECTFCRNLNPRHFFLLILWHNFRYFLFIYYV